MKWIRSKLSNLYHSLPIQLLLIQFNNHKSLLVFWLFLWALVGESIGTEMGMHHLLLEPQYMGKAGFTSYFLVGWALGTFIFTYFSSLYINESYRFHFVVLDRRPFFTFCLNASIVPILFMLFYASRFYNYYPLGTSIPIWPRVVGLHLGVLAVAALFGLYSWMMNRDVFSALGENFENRLERAEKRKTNQHRSIRRKRKTLIRRKAEEYSRINYRAASYFQFPFRLIEVRDVQVLSFKEIVSILNQNHRNLLALSMSFLLGISVLGLLEEYPMFQIPAAASFLMFFSMIVAIFGLLTFWFRKIGAFVFVIFVSLAYWFSMDDRLHERSDAFGMNYQVEPAEYTIRRMSDVLTDSVYEADRAATLQLLENWKANYQAKHGKGKKPKAVFVCASGGGMAASSWSFLILQQLDSMTNGKIADEMRLITGSSGGMFGVSYYRELQRLRAKGEPINMNDSIYAQNSAKENLNRATFKWLSDLLLPNRRFTYNNKTYDHESGYSFDKQLETNMPELKGKTIIDYRADEMAGITPQLILTPVIMNQGRQLFISATDVSYLSRPAQITEKYRSKAEGVELRRFFAEQEADSLWFSTALRMSATFPYAVPIVELPSEPPMQMIDAGLMDNYGTQTAVKYIYTFRDWLEENTEEIVIVQIRSYKRISPIWDMSDDSFVSKALAPLGVGYDTVFELQDMANDHMLEFMREWYQGKLEVVTFEYPSATADYNVSLTLCLTEKEKQNIRASLKTLHNRQRFLTVEELYEE